MATEVGSAYVQLLPSLRGFSRNVRSELKKALASVKDENIELGVDLHKDTDAKLQADLQKITARADKSVESIKLKADIARETNQSKISAQLEAIAKKAEANTDAIKLKAELNEKLLNEKVRIAAEVAEKRAKPIKLKVDLDKDSIFRLNAILSLLGSIAGAGAGLLKAGGVVAALFALGGAGVQVVASLVPLLGTLLKISSIAIALPAALGAVALAFGVVKLATSGLGDAFKALADGDAEKFNAALEKLAPSAREFVRSIAGIKPAFDSMQLNVQESFFTGLGGTVERLAGVVMPRLEAALIKVAQAFSTNLKNALETTMDSLGQFRLDQILGNLSSVVATLSNSFAPLTNALLSVLAVGAEFLNSFAGPATDAIVRFSDRVSELASNGTLTVWMQQGVEALKAFGQILKDVFGILTAITKAAENAVTPLGGLLSALNQVLNSSQGMSAMTSIFAAFGAAFDALVPVAQAFLPIIGTVIQVLSDLIVSIAPGATALFQSLATGLAKIIPAAKPVGEAFSTILQALTPVFPILGQLISDILPPLAKVLKEVGVQLGDALAKNVEKITPMLPDLVDAFIQFSEAIIPLIPDLVMLAQVASLLLPVLVQGLTNGFKTLAIILKVVTPLLHALQVPGKFLLGLFKQLWDILKNIDFGAILTKITEFAAKGIELITGFVTKVITFFSGMPTKILTFLTELPAKLGELFLQALNAAAFAVGFGIGIIYRFFTEFIPKAIGFLIDLPAKLLELFTSALQWARDAVSNGFNAVVGFFQEAPGRAIDALSSLGGRLYETGRDALNGLFNAVKSGADAVFGFFRGMPGQIRDAFGGIGNFMFGIGKDAVQGLINGIKSLAQAAKNIAADLGNSVKDGISKALRIGSPSKEAYQIGRWFDEGLIDGIIKDKDKAELASRALASAVVRPFPITATAGMDLTPGDMKITQDAPIRFEGELRDERANKLADLVSIGNRNNSRLSGRG